MKRANKASVLEVLFTAGVVAVVVAAVRPVFAGRILTGDAAVCMDNVRRIGLAMGQYMDDYDGYIPPNRYGQGLIWKDALQPYVSSDPKKAAAIYRCPANSYGNQVDESTRWPRSYAENGALSYGKFTSTNGAITDVRRADVKNPGRFMLVMESRNPQPDLGPWMIDGNAAPDGTWSNSSVKYVDAMPSTGLGVFFHHDKYMNVAMLDGHATSVTLPQTIAVPQMWNPWQAPDAYTGKLAGMLPEYK